MIRKPTEFSRNSSDVKLLPTDEEFYSSSQRPGAKNEKTAKWNQTNAGLRNTNEKLCKPNASSELHYSLRSSQEHANNPCDPNNETMARVYQQEGINGAKRQLYSFPQTNSRGHSYQQRESQKCAYQQRDSERCTYQQRVDSQQVYSYQRKDIQRYSYQQCDGQTSFHLQQTNLPGCSYQQRGYSPFPRENTISGYVYPGNRRAKRSGVSYLQGNASRYSYNLAHTEAAEHIVQDSGVTDRTDRQTNRMFLRMHHRSNQGNSDL